MINSRLSMAFIASFASISSAYARDSEWRYDDPNGWVVMGALALFIYAITSIKAGFKTSVGTGLFRTLCFVCIGFLSVIFPLVGLILSGLVVLLFFGMIVRDSIK